MGGEGDTLVKVGRGPKLTMFYGRSVSGRYGLGAPFCSFTQQGPTKPKAKRPTIPVPVPVPVPAQVPYRLTSWGCRGSGGVRSGVEGDIPPLGKADWHSEDPHTAKPSSGSQHRTPPPGKEHTRQAHLSFSGFRRAPRLSPSLHPIQFFPWLQRDAFLFSCSQPTFN